ncbi:MULTISPECIES: 16S rRNA (cytosine(1402)-N(4))-methyltransferase RsmH [Thioalkalivibrio]|uniref:Ribosomal RNA small subunit methyltransferase H n=1 Tax=Thioalkalivibrio halophilus TaxID=252474 RepID=A0A1V2ZVP1_9GAMM|nr:MULTISPECIES: 16S rRNA (cytosine(1402)-N(4))-methyltransferase RsmH [Thioalkalivibrio]OOC09184.1 16S rRNA (cytosine(1402)-N(4))-methyltransferase [Thioalkalivibrio halophilus]
MQEQRQAHVPVMLDTVLEGLAVRADGFYVDGTFGRGGHSRALLDRLGPDGRLLAMDRDPEAAEAASSFLGDPRFAFESAPFSSMAEVLRQRYPDRRPDGVFLDLGVSSPQLDDAARGFSFQHDGPLDMRMDPSSGESAADWLARAEEKEIADVIYQYGEERFSRRIARAIVRARAEGPITRTARLADLVRGAVPRREPGKHPATRTFQALRIFVNAELRELETWLETIPEVLPSGARLVVIAFHSLEDRMVKRAFRGDRDDAPRIPRGLPVMPEVEAPPLRPLGKPVRADAGEQQRNPRARSAVLRVAERN